jgi:hypothetical protein
MVGVSSRTFGRFLPALLALLVASASWSAEGAAKPKKKLLYFTKSSGFEHSVVKRTGDQLAYSEKIMIELGKAVGYEIVCSKDGTLLNPDKIGQWDGFLFYATGDLTKPAKSDPAPPMTPEGKKALLDAIAAGKGFVGIHAGNDAFRLGKVDPFIRMLGGEFVAHGAQQKSWSRIKDSKFPGMDGIQDFELQEEWYAPKNLAADLHVIILQDTKGMTGPMYEKRPAYPASWARMQGKGRVYYTSLGHREDVWDNPLFRKILMGGVTWAMGDAQAEIPPNLKEVAPQPAEFMAPAPVESAK